MPVILQRLTSEAELPLRSRRLGSKSELENAELRIGAYINGHLRHYECPFRSDPAGCDPASLGQRRTLCLRTDAAARRDAVAHVAAHEDIEDGWPRYRPARCPMGPLPAQSALAYRRRGHRRCRPGGAPRRREARRMSLGPPLAPAQAKPLSSPVLWIGGTVVALAIWTGAYFLLAPFTNRVTALLPVERGTRLGEAIAFFAYD